MATTAPADLSFKPSVIPLSRHGRSSEALVKATPIRADEVAGLIGRRAIPGIPLVVGLTGSVAAGKSTLASAIADRLAVLIGR